MPFRKAPRGEINTADERLDDLELWRAAVERWLAALDAQGTAVLAAADVQQRTLDALVPRIARLERHDSLRTFTSWIASATLATSPLVSIVLPTRSRAAFLSRAVGSVLGQVYRNWELVVVDNGSTDDTGAVVASFDDPRIRLVDGTGGGACAARNVGREAAAGMVVAYLDDDNAMEPLWLKAVVWAFEQRPDVEVVYGGLVIDDTARQLGVAGWELPSLWLHDYDRAALLRANLADTSSMAHRAGIAARWDAALDDMGDWDFLSAATESAPPLVLPVAAARYLSDASGRLSERSASATAEHIRRKHGGGGS